MKDFWKKYKAVLRDYPTTVADAGKEVIEVFLHLLALSLPLTFPVLYPLYQLGTKLKAKLFR